MEGGKDGRRGREGMKGMGKWQNNVVKMCDIAQFEMITACSVKTLTVLTRGGKAKGKGAYVWYEFSVLLFSIHCCRCTNMCSKKLFDESDCCRDCRDVILSVNETFSWLYCGICVTECNV